MITIFIWDTGNNYQNVLFKKRNDFRRRFNVKSFTLRYGVRGQYLLYDTK